MGVGFTYDRLKEPEFNGLFYHWSQMSAGDSTLISIWINRVGVVDVLCSIPQESRSG